VSTRLLIMSLGLFSLPGLTSGDAVEAPSNIPEITVIAPKPVDPKLVVNENIAAFVHSHGRAGKRTGQFGRWGSPLCPEIQGMTPAFSDFVSIRVRTIAAAVQRHASATDDCKSNVLIAFTGHPQAYLDEVAKQHPGWLGFHYVAELPKLKLVTRPIQSWYVTATRSRVGGLAVVDDVGSSRPPAEIGSRLKTGLESYIVFVLVVIDTNNITGHAIGAISDYIAVLSLAQTSLADTCGQLPSILDLMVPDCGEASPDSITASDLAYLQALYKISLPYEAASQQFSIEDIMLRELRGVQ
jgi:hypothetical protein